MKLITISTGSSGNTYLLTNGKETLVLDCGVKFIDAKKALNFQIKGIVGAVVSHCHGDHAKYTHEYETAGITVWKPYTMESLRNSTQLGGFKVQSFDLVHNVPCCGFLISHGDFGKMLYVTDTEYVPYRFRDLSVMLIEANYDEQYVDKTQVKWQHVLTGHMSLTTTMDCIEANKTTYLNHIILCHLSEGNADSDAFRLAVSEIAPAGCTVDIAASGLEVELGEVPF